MTRLAEQTQRLLDDVPEAAGTRSSPAGDRYSSPAGLTPRELEVLRLVAAGHSTRAIAAQLGVSERTVEHHVAHIYRKIDARGRVDATAFALRHGVADQS